MNELEELMSDKFKPEDLILARDKLSEAQKLVEEVNTIIRKSKSTRLLGPIHTLGYIEDFISSVSKELRAHQKDTELFGFYTQIKQEKK